MVMALYLLRKYYTGLSLAIVYMNMNIPHPANHSYTIYSKSGCIYCTKAKELLQNEKPKLLYVDCDKFLLENKEEFLNQMKKLIGREYKTFPMIFKNGVFLGGYMETKKAYDQNEIIKYAIW